MAQIHKNFTDDQVKELLGRYLRKEVKRSYIQEVLSIGKTRLFALCKSYRADPEKFSVQYARKISNRRIEPGLRLISSKSLSCKKD